MSPFEVLCLTTVLMAGCVSDMRARRIPNGLVGVAALTSLGLALHARGWEGLWFAAGGAATGLGIWLPFWLLRMLGAGDVKFFAATATWLGPAGAIEAALITGLCGGLLSVLYVMHRHGLRSTVFRVTQSLHHPLVLREPSQSAFEDRIPYALAMAAGIAIAAFRPGVLL